MIKEAMQYIVGLGKTEIVDIAGRKYSTERIIPVRDPEPEALKISTLTSLVEYIKSDVDKISANGNIPRIIYIESPTSISLLLPMKGEFKQREMYLRVEPVLPQIVFGQFKDQEQFIIEMQSKFVDTEDRAIVLQLAGNLKDEMVRTMEDDGISQVATVKSGVAKVSDVVVPNPVSLAPYRTFLEVTQPSSKFLFRIREGGNLAIFEADGGAWRNEAMNNIKTYLEENLKGQKVTILS